MTQQGTQKRGGKNVELATFYVGKALCGLDILKIQEINKLMEMTSVPQAPDYVRGILNLRGQIVTAIDIGKKLGLSSTIETSESRNIIINSQGEYIGLMVDNIGDVVRIQWDMVEQPPANIKNIQGEFFDGVFLMEDSLIGILNIEKVLMAGKPIC